jgi:hypothetical protein
MPNPLSSLPSFRFLNLETRRLFGTCLCVLSLSLLPFPSFSFFRRAQVERSQGHYQEEIRQDGQEPRQNTKFLRGPFFITPLLVPLLLLTSLSLSPLPCRPWPFGQLTRRRTPFVCTTRILKKKKKTSNHAPRAPVLVQLLNFS